MTPHHTTPHYTIPYHTTPHHTTPHHIIIVSPFKLRLVGTTSSVVDYHLPFVPSFNNNILTKKLEKQYKATAWYRGIITSLFQINSTSWNEYCSLIYKPPSKEIIAPAKESLLKLVAKYYISCTDLSISKQKWFSRNLNQYENWSVVELLKWIWIARRILRRQKQSIKIKIN